MQEWRNAPHNRKQIEPRTLAHMSADHDLQRPYLTGGDLYVESALKLYGEKYNMRYEQFLEADDVTWRERGLPKHPRKLFKQGLLATMYETSAYGLSTMLDISVEEGQQFIDDFHANFPTAYQYAKDSIAFVDEHGYCLTMNGRKRRFPNHVKIAKQYHSLMQRAERIVGHRIKNIWQEQGVPYKLKQQIAPLAKDYNTVIRQVVNARTQGSAAEIMKLAMVKLDAYLNSMGQEWKLIGTIHDEVLIEVPQSITEQEFREVENCMLSAITLDIPLKTDIAVMKRWSEDVPLTEFLQKGMDCFDSDGFVKTEN